MRIDELRSDVTGAGMRVVCRITWQKQRRKAATLWFDLDPAAAGPVATGAGPTTAWANAAATAALPLAIMHGEDVLEVDAPVCAQLAQGLEQFAQAMRRCFPRRNAVQLIADRVATAPAPGAGRAIFLSGGVDSLALLCHERVHGGLTSEPPLSRGLHIFGLNTYDFAGGEPVGQRIDSFRRYLERLQALGRASDIEVAGVATNARALFPDFAAWASFGWVPGTVAAAHLFSGTMSGITLASANTAVPTHPADVQLQHVSLLSSAAMQIGIGLAGVTRLEKTRLVAAAPEALAVLRSCFRIDLPAGGVDNCGTCEKCVRTRLALLALGKLGEAVTYPRHPVRPEILDSISTWKPETAEHYAELVRPLAEAGRPDMADAVSTMLARITRPARTPTLLERARTLLARAKAGRSP